jgi:putative transposase
MDNSVREKDQIHQQRHAANSPAESEQAALKCLCLVTRSLDPTGTGRTRWTMRTKPVINAFAVTCGDRWPDAETC